MTLTEFTTQGLRIDPLSPEQIHLLPALEEFALAALEGGVAHSWKDWVGFSDLERVAWINAGKRYRAQEARRVALAQRGEQGYMLAAADTEGTLEADKAAARRALEMIHGA